MRTLFAVSLMAGLAAVSTFAATPAQAGTLAVDNGQTVWHSTQCTKPTAPASVASASADTSGEDMNTLITEHNAYVDAMQAYMNCISDEASRDQASASQTITTDAQKAIADANNEVNKASAVLRERQGK